VSVVSTPVPLVDDPEGPVSTTSVRLRPIRPRLTCCSFSSCRQEEVKNQPKSSPFFGRRRAFPGDPLWSVFSCFIHNVLLQPCPFVLTFSSDSREIMTFLDCFLLVYAVTRGRIREVRGFWMSAMVDMKKQTLFLAAIWSCSRFAKVMACSWPLFVNSEDSVGSLVAQSPWDELVNRRVCVVWVTAVRNVISKGSIRLQPGRRSLQVQESSLRYACLSAH